MPKTVPSLFPDHQATFTGRLATLGFVRQDDEAGWRGWVGRVRVTWHDAAGKKLARVHSVRIMLGPGFPFQKPEVVPLDTDPPIAGERHQAPGLEGALCLYPDEGRGWMPECTADDLVDRVRTWFTHYHRDNWPDRDWAPDLHLYFNTDGLRPLMVFGDDWKPVAGREYGRFGVWQATKRYAFAGSPSEADVMPPQQHPDRLLPLLGLSEVPHNRVGLWFRLQHEPRPQGALGDMLREIDRCGGWEPGTARQQVRFLMGDKVRDARHSHLTLALGYPGRDGQEQWLFLEATAAPSGKHRRWSRAGDELPVRSYEPAPAGKHDLMRRTGHTAALLTGKRVLVFGVGAIGSSVALLLAKAGIESLALVDSDLLRPGNAVRHEAGLGSIGRAKTWAVGLEVWHHAPDCAVTRHPTSWDPAVLSERVRSADIVVDATANKSFSLLLNHVCCSAGKPAVYVAAYRRGAVGRVRVVRPGCNACKMCYEYSMPDDYPHIPVGAEGGFVEAGCGVPTVEVSAVDVEAVANVAARAALHVLTEEQGDQSECIIVNEPLSEGAAIFSKPGIWWFSRSPAESCVECGQRSG